MRKYPGMKWGPISNWALICWPPLWQECVNTTASREILCLHLFLILCSSFSRDKALGCFSCLVWRKWISFSSSVVNQMHTIRDHTGPFVFNFFTESESLLKNMSAISASKVTIRHISCPPVTHESKRRFVTTAFVFSIEVFPSNINL